MKTLFRWIADYSRTVLRSLTDLGFYREVRGRKLGDAAGHLAVTVSAFWLVPLIIAFFVGANAAWVAFSGFVRTNFPPEARFEIKDGTLTNNLERPVVAPVGGGGVIVVDAASTTTAFGAGEWGFIVGPTGLTQRSASGTPDQFSAWPQDAQASFTRTQLLDGARRALPWLVAVFAVLGLVFAVLIAAIAVAALVAFHAALLWLLLKLLQRPIRFYEAVVLAGYAATLPILAHVLFSMGQTGSSIPTLLYWILLGLIARDLYAGGKNLGPETKEPAPQDHGSA